MESSGAVAGRVPGFAGPWVRRSQGAARLGAHWEKCFWDNGVYSW
jgi:hypothetical protein